MLFDPYKEHPFYVRHFFVSDFKHEKHEDHLMLRTHFRNVTSF